MRVKKIAWVCALISIFQMEAGEHKGFLTKEEVTEFHKKGYLLKKSCLNSDDIHKLEKNVAEMLEESFQKIKESNSLDLLDQDQMIYDNDSRIVFRRIEPEKISIARINGVGGIKKELLNTIRSEKMIHTFFELLGTSDIEHLISQIHPKLPGDGISFPRHRDVQFRKSSDPDWQDILGNGSYAICVIPIDPMTFENGGLWIDQNNYPEYQGLEENILWVEANPGDLLFMHPYLFHGSGPNLSQNSRRTLLTGFCAFGANQRPYFGSEVNIHFTLLEDGTIISRPSPWAKKVSVSEGHH